MTETFDTQGNTKQEILNVFYSEHVKLFDCKVTSGEWNRLPELSKEEEAIIEEFTTKSIKRKMEEEGHKRDPEKERLRISNGKRAEWALMKYVDLPAPDMTIGESFNYMGQDLELHGKKFGIKCSKLGQAALVFKKPKMPEIILVQKGDNFYLCGIASPKLMRENNEQLLMKSALNTQKAGFTINGYENLENFHVVVNYLKSEIRNKISKTTQKSVDETYKMVSQLLKHEEFKYGLRDYEVAQKAFEE